MIDEKGQKLPYLDKYIILIVGDLNNELLKFKSGELDTVGLRGTNVSLFKEKRNFQIIKYTTSGLTQVQCTLRLISTTAKTTKASFM